jgi:hypothetical protein
MTSPPIATAVSRCCGTEWQCNSCVALCTVFHMCKELTTTVSVHCGVLVTVPSVGGEACSVANGTLHGRGARLCRGQLATCGWLRSIQRNQNSGGPHPRRALVPRGPVRASSPLYGGPRVNSSISAALDNGSYRPISKISCSISCVCRTNCMSCHPPAALVTLWGGK